MKCMICSGGSLPGSKLCKPCRSALRRARDDTISELMPLPRRMDALAWQYPLGGTTRLQVVDVAAQSSTHEPPSFWQALVGRVFTLGGGPPLRTAGLTLVTVAVGGLAFIGTQQMRVETHENAARVALAAPIADTQTRISPVSLVEAARESALPSAEPTVVETPAAAPLSQPAPVRPRRATPDRPRETAAPVSAMGDPIAAFAEEERPRPPALPTSPPAAVAAPQIDRWQALSAALARCGTFDLWNRAICEHAARSRHCEGFWGHNGMCAAGIVNDHGQ